MRSEVYLAPSWSWLSIANKVTLVSSDKSDDIIPTAEMISCTVESKSLIFPLLKIQSGKLALRTKVLLAPSKLLVVSESFDEDGLHQPPRSERFYAVLGLHPECERLHLHRVPKDHPQ